MELYFATSNAGKVADVEQLLAGTDISVQQLHTDMIEPSVDSLAPIARAKVEQAVEQADVSGYVMADDSGLFVDELDGFPGPQTAFFDDTVGKKKKLLRLVDEEEPAASFRTAIALHDPEADDIRVFEGRCDGVLVEPRGDGGFGYDPLFRPDGHDRTFAEDMEHKQRVSHRQEAMQALKAYLIED